MQSDTLHVPFWMLAAGALLALPLTSCTTTSNLTAVSSTNTPAQNSIDVSAPTEPSGEAATADDLNADQPAVEDQVAQHRPAPTGPPIVLTSVPRTSVENRPTNQIMMIRTTAYSHLQADSLPYGRKSAAGNDLMYGAEVRSAAADWSKYPLGTKFQIEGLPYTYVVDDYGSALCGTETIDIYKPDLSGIGRWGVRNLPVRVLEWGSFEESANILRGRTHVKHAHHVRTMLREIEKKGKAGYLSKPSGGSA
ncbi:MAG: 3D domain-containing protein [Verrucomicrobiales bacterium]|nr:3D domain-containing protein [Verrucomicrobiales bacterium]